MLPFPEFPIFVNGVMISSVTQSKGFHAEGILLYEESLPFCFIQAINWLGKTHPHDWGAVCFTQLTDLNINLMKNTLLKYPDNNI